MPLIYVSSLDDARLDAYARLTEAQLRSKLEPERALFIAESEKVIERAFEGGMAGGYGPAHRADGRTPPRNSICTRPPGH